MSCPRLAGEAAAALLAEGGVLLLATDTICGLHARADQGAALERVLALKGRHPGQPFLLLASSLEQALSLCGPVSAGVQARCRAAWPGPFTFILPAAAGLHDLVRDGVRGTVAVRVPAREDLRRLIGQAGGPLASTSANRTGEAPLTGLEAALAAFGPLVDGWWGGDGEPGEGAPGAPSALVDLTVAPPRILRPGPQPLPDPA
jgi:L-threonylcarbamoyladenylate synthase